MTGLCGSCGDERIEAEYTAALDTAADELRDRAEAIIIAEDLAAVRKAINALKKLAK